ncbi:MAG: YraN family protein [Leptolyngbyaceae cyanobacterium CRU_2_3]|nr:YraN family protein [Leptolyngbyaceae cyanobacterium CRU_2_3]
MADSVSPHSLGSQSPKSTRQLSLELGKLAEDLVAQWLIQQGWEILQRRWRCKLGELDLIIYTANPASTQTPLAFVEVKARSSGNWDTNGLLSITPRKQDKLWRSAQLFLANYPHLAELPCRFDVALVSCRKRPTSASGQSTEAIQNPVSIEMKEQCDRSPLPNARTLFSGRI